MAGDETLLQLAGPPSATCFHKGSQRLGVKGEGRARGIDGHHPPACHGGRGQHGIAQGNGAEESQRRGDVAPGHVARVSRIEFPLRPVFGGGTARTRGDPQPGHSQCPRAERFHPIHAAPRGFSVHDPVCIVTVGHARGKRELSFAPFVVPALAGIPADHDHGCMVRDMVPRRDYEHTFRLKAALRALDRRLCTSPAKQGS